MHGSKKLFIVSFLVLLLASSPLFSFSSRVFHHPRSTDKLSKRWDWAVQEAKKQGVEDGFWIGYSIKRLMGEYSYISSTSRYHFRGYHPFLSRLEDDTLEKIIYGRDTSPVLSGEEQVKLAAKIALAEIENRRRPGRTVWKDIAILFKFESRSSQVPEAVRLNNLTLPFDLEGFSLFWLDKTEDEESVSLLSSLYERSIPEQLKKRILSAIGFHGSPELVVPFLDKVLKSKEPDSLRGRAASELEDHETEQALKILHQTAKNDRSFEVRKKAVYALEDMYLPGATEALIDIARNTPHTEIRERAISSLAEKASEKVAATLEDLAYEDENTEVQKRAVYALEDLPDGQGIPYLIKIAKTHWKVSIRKRAINCLGDSGDPRALQALIDILKEK
ncbi:MAG: HEAT repeat domain-containing protein [Candidatus Aminicenantes bacterium]|nr:MAG: HEAT repeat domain-containing protein [Candidatus Aminicenantes bacterium]